MRALTATIVLSSSLLTGSLLTACYPTPGPDKTFTGAVLGAGWGAGAGAAIGHQTGNIGPGAAVGAGLGAVSGAVTGIGLDIAEGTELRQQRELDALKVQVAANHRSLMEMQNSLDNRERGLRSMSSMDQVFFDPDRASLRAGGASRLQRLSDSLKFNPYIGSIELHGHTDDTGDTERNMRLSEARARSVATFLANQGVSLDKMEIIPHGAERPLGSNETDTGKQLNRRVEIVLKR